MQFTGLAAMLRVLLHENNEVFLTENELKGLVNLMHRVSDSVKWYKEFRESEDRHKTIMIILFCLLSVLAVVLIAIGFLVLC